MIRSAPFSRGRGSGVHRTAREPLIVRLAPLAGTALRMVRRTAFGVAGALCVVGGIAMIYRPAGLIALGALFLLADRAS